MKLAIMQPYFFPYVGYFQLIRAVDAFVVYDDVNYIKGGWVNRNYILGNDEGQLITLPLQGASQNKLINQIKVGGSHKILQSLRHRYSKAPHFEIVYPILEEIFNQTETNLALFLDFQLRRICEYLGLYPKWYISSELKKDKQLRGQQKILEICDELNASHYINMPGGRELYENRSFELRDLKISFIQPRSGSYTQFARKFVPHLSIIDVMMFNDKDQCARLLEEYDLS